MTDFIDLNLFYKLLLVFLRVGSFLLAFPFMSSQFLPLNVRILLILAFSFYLTSISNFQSAEISILTAVKELLIGIILAGVSVLAYSIVVYSAEIIGYLMGLTVVNMFDPSFGRVSVVGRFFAFLFYAIFFASGAYQGFIYALAESFKILPIGTLSIHEGIFKFFIETSEKLFLLGFKLAFPFLITLFIANLVLALSNRLIPQINVFIVGLPFQIMVGLFFLSIGFFVVVNFTVGILKGYIKDVYAVLNALR